MRKQFHAALSKLKNTMRSVVFNFNSVHHHFELLTLLAFLKPPFSYLSNTSYSLGVVL